MAPKERDEKRERDARAIHLFIPEAWHERLRERSFRERTPIAELVRRALEDVYRELPPRDREEMAAAH